MYKNIFRTNFSQHEIREAVKQFINLKKKGNLDEIYLNKLEIKKKNEKCRYCHRECDSIFCSTLCDLIFYGNIMNIFEYSNKSKVDLFPIELIKNKEDIYNIIDKYKNYKNFKGFISLENKDFIFELHVIEKYKVKFKNKIKIDIVENNDKCIYCNQTINESIYISINDIMIYFCSDICKGTYSKILERYVTIENYINLYIPPIIFFENENEIYELIKISKRIDYIIGGLKEFTDDSITLSLLTSL